MIRPDIDKNLLRGGTYKAFVGKLEGNERLEDLEVDGKAILKWILKK